MPRKQKPICHRRVKIDSDGSRDSAARLTAMVNRHETFAVPRTSANRARNEKGTFHPLTSLFRLATRADYRIARSKLQHINPDKSPRAMQHRTTSHNMRRLLAADKKKKERERRESTERGGEAKRGGQSGTR